MKTQKGSAHAILVTILVLALIGALGFIFWQNFIDKKSTETKKETSTTTDKPPADEDTNKTPASDNKVYTNEELTFEYPSTGWIEKDDPYVDNIARIETEDYKPSVGMGLDAGASLIIDQTTQTKVPQAFGVKNVEELQIDGKKAFKYLIEYEGYRLQAVFTASSSKGYLITMQTKSTPTADETEAFDLVLETLDVK